MQEHTFVAMAAEPTAAIVRNIRPDQLGAPTPCSEYDLRKLINHLLFWAPTLEGSARKQAVAPPAASDGDIDLTDADGDGDGWAAELEARIDRLVSAWNSPDAWHGATVMGGPTAMPAAMVGGMVVGELVVHTWDLARSTGQEAKWDEAVLSFVYLEVDKTAGQGRDMGIYGPAVPVPGTASILDRILGLTGRDPKWTPDRAG